MSERDTEYLMLSALQHYAFCPRQFALIHIEQVWAENRYTMEGKILHERVDSGAAEQRGEVRHERGVLLESKQFRIKGKMDLLEIIQQGDETVYFPVEYKRGKPKTEDWDRVQLCAQALCLEEMRSVSVREGAIWYWQERRRKNVVLDDRLRAETLAVITAAHKLKASVETPPPIVEKKRCRACSLLDLCEPDLFRKDASKTYIEKLYTV